MIKTNIDATYNHQHRAIKTFNDDLFVADYTKSTNRLPVKRGVEFFSPNHPADINFFSIINSKKFFIDGIEFNSSSFVCGNGNSRTQCEAVFFPSVSNHESWILFCELKYCSLEVNNFNDLTKAVTQLYKTRYYYIQNSIISLTNICYLVASLPLQTEPFANFHITPQMLMKLKSKRNIILRLTNIVKVNDDKSITV